jgi:hypothetical protein
LLTCLTDGHRVARAKLGGALLERENGADGRMEERQGKIRATQGGRGGASGAGTADDWGDMCHGFDKGTVDLTKARRRGTMVTPRS